MEQKSTFQKTIGYTYAKKKKNLYADLYPSQELTQSGSQT